MNPENKNKALFHSIALMVSCFLLGTIAYGGDIKPSVEFEFNMFYDRNFPQPFAFQMREAKLFLDTDISERSGGLIEYVMQEDLKRGELERLYFIHRELPLHGQLTIGQFRSPFGYYDAFTVSHSLTKNTEVSPDNLLPSFKLRSLDVGVLWETLAEQYTVSLAVVNGNGINSIRDDNSFKDIIVHTMYSIDNVQVGVNGYYGRKNSLNSDGSVRAHSSIEVSAIGAEMMVVVDDAVIAGEAIFRKYDNRESIGGYVMMNYDLTTVIHSLRSVTRVEAFDPNRSLGEDLRFQMAQGFRYTIDRGYTLKLEYIMNLENPSQQFNSGFLELEYEL